MTSNNRSLHPLYKPKTVIIAGAGPGALDLITLRCQRAVTEAEIIIYAGSLVNPEVLKFSAPECEIFDSAAMTLDEMVAVMVKGIRAGKKVLRLHTGDPAMYGAISEQINALSEAEIDVEIIPGVSSVFAAAACVKAELTLPEVTQTVILSRRAGRTPVPERESITELARHQATMALFLSVSAISELVSELLAGGYKSTTPVAVVYRATWPDEKIVSGNLADIAERIEKAEIGRQAMILVGDALGRKGALSRLYAEEFSHGYREVNIDEKN
ncbi:MAG: precorrin-4 C(11)-methyltransferase [Deltaproteobacteria bacterium]|nr:precorrin-4 C(11)-methyltransferase [Candidatus Tharpella sp.]